MPHNEDFTEDIDIKNFDEENVGSAEDELFEHYRFVVDKGQSQMRIDKYLSDKISKISRNRVQNAIRDGAVLVDNEPVKPNFTIKPNQIISVLFPNMPHEGGVVPEKMPLDIIYEDDDLIVLNKPAGLVCHPGVGNRNGTLINGLAYYFQEKLPNFNAIGDEERPGLVHRIDKDTSGLLVVAKTSFALNHLAKQFFDHTTGRTYWALVWGEPEKKTGTVTLNVGRDPHDPTIIMAFPEGDHGKHAITHYKAIQPMYYVSLIECKLETGRTHQIRIHMKYLGHPLFMDKRYGGDKILKGTIFTKYRQFAEKAMDTCPRQALHAKTLSFDHPTTGQRMEFNSELPTDFATCLKLWENYVEDRKALL